jgi:hypothetical protein
MKAGAVVWISAGQREGPLSEQDKDDLVCSFKGALDSRNTGGNTQSAPRGPGRKGDQDESIFDYGDLGRSGGIGRAWRSIRLCSIRD